MGQNLPSDQEILSAVSDYLRTRLAIYHYPPQGADSRVFMVRDLSGREWVIKSGQSAKGEAIVYRLLDQYQVKLPRPRLKGELTLGDCSIVILEKISAPLLEAVPRESLEEFIIPQLETLRELHRITSTRPGLLVNNESNRLLKNKLSWSELLARKFNGQDLLLNWPEILQRQSLDGDLIARAIDDILMDLEQLEYTGNEYSLLHTDYNQRNLFVDLEKQKIVGVIDWAEALFGDPIYDTARVRMWIWHFNLDRNAIARYNCYLNYSPEEKKREELYLRVRVLEYLAYYSEDLTEFNLSRISLHQRYLRERSLSHVTN